MSRLIFHRLKPKALAARMAHTAARAFMVWLCGWQIASAQVLGPDLSDCLSALHPGLRQCETSHPDNFTNKTSAPFDPMQARIDDFLSQYGKPPRAAIRALLDPSDDNIRLMILQQQDSLGMATYLAARMTQLQNAFPVQVNSPVKPDAFGSLLAGKSLVYYTQQNDVNALISNISPLILLAQSFPSLSVQIAVVGQVSAEALRQLIRQLPPTLLVRRSGPEWAANTSLPALVLSDAHHQQVIDISDAMPSLQDLLTDLASPLTSGIRPSRLNERSATP